MKSVKWLIGTLLIGSILGCGQSNEAIMPTGELTPEQIEAVKKEDSSVEEEESQGKMQGGKAVKAAK